MGLFEQFPFTNYHQLNLDWILEEVKKITSKAVFSVNGQTGDVILYQDPDIEFPAINSDVWRMVRTANGTTVGVAFQWGKMFVMNGNQASQVYTDTDQPPYPVTSVDGQTGAVEVFPNAATRLKDVTDSYTNIRRQIQTAGVDNIVGIELTANKAYRMKDQYRYELYDSDNQPPYPVTSVNGQTGTVILAIPFNTPLTDSIWQASQASTDHHAGIARDTVDGNVVIYTETSSVGVDAYVSFLSTDESVNITKKLLTTDDIPSSSGVVSFNGQTGVVTLYGDGLYIDSGSSKTVTGAIQEVQNDLAFVVVGDTVSSNVPEGSYVLVTESTITGVTDGLYKAVNNVSSGTPFTAADLSAVAAGGLNELNDDITDIKNYISTYDLGTGFASLTALESALSALGDAMNNSDVKNIKFSTSAALTPLIQAGYMGTIKRYAASRYAVMVQEFTNYGQIFTGNYRNTWSWAAI